METIGYKVFVKIKSGDKVGVYAPFLKAEGVVEFVGYGLLYIQYAVIFDGNMNRSCRTVHIHKIF